MATKLGLYNQALLAIGSQRLTALTDAEERRYRLDDCYDNVLAECLESGQWNFATKAVEIQSEDSIEPTFGYSYAFLIPSDLANLTGISSSETFNPPLDRYSEEVGYWWADVDPIYVQYVSSDSDYGGDLTAWTPSYERYVYLTLAERVCMALTEGDAKFQAVMQMAKKAKRDAMANDAMGQSAPVVRAGSWVSSRFSSMYSGRRYLRG